MIVYSGTKQQFNHDVMMNEISDIIQKKIRDHHLPGGKTSEYRSWHNSLQYMRNVLDDPDISEDVNIAIEYQIPRTSKRVDFMIAGSDEHGQDNVVIVELKQWDMAEKVDDIMEHSVRTYTGSAIRTVNHPSYQAYAYATFIRSSAEQLEDDDIQIVPCAYLHNYKPEYIGALNDSIYEDWYKEAPFFIKTEMMKMRAFVKNTLRNVQRTATCSIRSIMAGSAPLKLYRIVWYP